MTDEEPRKSYVCHCLACQRRTGAIVHSGAFFSKSRVRLDGPRSIYTRVADSGAEVKFYFCPTCGTTVVWESNKYPDDYGIAVGCFADPSFPVPMRSVFEESKHLWLELPPGIERLAKGLNPDGTPMA
jgi:hypothetical protein